MLKRMPHLILLMMVPAFGTNQREPDLLAEIIKMKAPAVTATKS